MPPLKTAYELGTQNANISLTAVFIQTKTKAKTDVSALLVLYKECLLRTYSALSRFHS